MLCNTQPNCVLIWPKGLYLQAWKPLGTVQKCDGFTSFTRPSFPVRAVLSQCASKAQTPTSGGGRRSLLCWLHKVLKKGCRGDLSSQRIVLTPVAFLAFPAKVRSAHLSSEHPAVSGFLVGFVTVKHFCCKSRAT